MALKFRRGTTAQQSGSLAYGEPYVNTTLGTLLVGGASGDIQLTSTGPSATFVGASVSASSFVSASSLKVTGNAAIDGNLTLGGAITIGDASSDTVNVVASLSSSLIPQTSNAFDLGSVDKIWRDLYISTGSIKIVDGNGNVVNTITNQNLVTTSSLASGSINLANSLPAGTTSGSSQINVLQTTNIARLATTGSNTFRGNQTVNGLIYASASLSDGYHTFSGSARFIEGQVTFENNNTTVYGALNFMNPSQDASLTLQNIGDSGTNKLILAVQQLEILGNTTLSGSFTLNGYPLVNTNQISSLNSATASYARKDSANIFQGNQTITGSLYVTQDLVVQGSSSIQNISSSTLNIGTNLVTVATNNPSVRFGGIAVVDSGSAGGSGSFLYDSIQDEFVFVHRGNGVNTTSSVFLLGPETYDNLGNEAYLTANTILKSTGKEHIVDSNITDSGTLITLGSNTVVTGTLSASGTALVSASAQIDHNSTTNYVANRHIDHTSVLISAGNGLSGGGDISSTRTLALDTASSTFTTGVKTALNTNTVISGSSQVDVTLTTGDIALGSRTSGNYVASLVAGTNITLSNNSGESATPTIGLTNNSITIAGTSTALGGTITAATILSGTGVVSGSSQITAGSTTNFATDVKTQLNSNTVVSGSGQVAITSTSGFGTYINQALLTNSAVTHGNLTINGTITATGDITAFFTSDIRHKNNVELIDNALDKVNALNGVTWEWNDDVDEVTKQTPTTGLIAQDVLDVLPEVVKTRENGFLALDYSKMVGLLVEAIKEQDVVIQKLKSDMTQLSTTITVFEDRMKEKGLL
jgi:trimeric autotransporter adhesin